MKIQTDDFFIGNLENNEVPDLLLETVGNSDGGYEAGVGTKGDSGVDHKYRKCNVKWIPVKKVNFIENGMRRIVNEVNNLSWNMELDQEWQTGIQVTFYEGKGHFYNWHKDDYGKSSDGIRRLSIVYCLSHKTDYVGGEFQIKTSDGGTYTRKFDYGDFIIFPSTTLHRVKKLKSGKRTTLVGWYR